MTDEGEEHMAGKVELEETIQYSDLDDQLTIKLYVVSRLLVRNYNDVLDRLGLTFTRYLSLKVLSDKGSLSVKDLGEQLYLDSGTLTPLLKKLERSGLITRQRSDSDERRLEVSLTAKGQELFFRAENMISIDLIRQRCDPDLKHVLLNNLSCLIEELDKR